MQANLDFARSSYSLRNIIEKGPDLRGGIEREISTELQRSNGISAVGVMVPFEVLTRDLSVTGGAGFGQELVESTLQKTVADSIKPYSAVIGAGARVIENQVGNFVFPRRQSFTPANWQTAENSADTETSMVFSQLVLQPCRLTLESHLSKWLISQSADRSIEQFIKETLLKDIAATLDAAALIGAGPGTGTDGAPLGILAQTENTGSPPYQYGFLAPGVTFGGAPTYATILQQRFNVEQSDVIDDGTLTWITSPNAKMVLGQTPILSGFPKFIWDEKNNKIAGYRAVATSNLAGTDQLVFGRWSDYLFVLWGIDIVSDPFSLAGANEIKIVINLLANCGTLKGISFSRSEDSAAQ